jgi:hypothetical protein
LISASDFDTVNNIISKHCIIKKILSQDTHDSLDIIDILKIKRKNDHIGNGPFFSILPGFGYALSTGFSGNTTTNLAFYFDTSHNHLSTIYSNYNYSDHNQFWMIHNLNIFLFKEKINFTSDWEYYSFPTYDFGLGGNTTPSDAFQINYNYIRLYQNIFYEIGENLYTGSGYMLDYHWNISEIPNQNMKITDFDKYGRYVSSVSSGISMSIEFDNRTNSINPQQGAYINIRYRDNLKMLGSDNNWQQLLIDTRKYLKFPEESKNILSFWNYNTFTLFGNPPYLDLPSIGWDEYANTGRGYVQGRFRGKNLVDFETEYRLPLTRNGLLGAVIFGDVETLSEKISSNYSSPIPGGGFGLRIKINKKSNTNVAIDYGFGKEGSHGFFFNLGEVF